MFKKRIKKTESDQIEDLLTDHWERGFKSGVGWQKDADREVFEEEKGPDAYDKGSEEGYNAGLKEQKEEDARTKEELIANVYSDGYDNGYSVRLEEQKEEDEAKLEDAYERGYDKGFEQGRASASKE